MAGSIGAGDDRLRGQGGPQVPDLGYPPAVGRPPHDSPRRQLPPGNWNRRLAQHALAPSWERSRPVRLPLERKRTKQMKRADE